jgi:hypothetical protein
MKLAFAFVLVASLSGFATYFGGSALRAHPRHVAREYVLVSQTTPTAAEFGRALMGTANQFGSDAKIARTHCVQAKPGRYMCSYAVVRRGQTDECHLMQGRWTPDAESTITVTLAGRAARCGSLRDAIDSLE